MKRHVIEEGEQQKRKQLSWMMPVGPRVWWVGIDTNIQDEDSVYTQVHIIYIMFVQ